MRVFGLVAPAASGCHLVFGSDPGAAGDAALADTLADAPAPDAVEDASEVPDAARCIGTDHTATLIADTFIIPEVVPSPANCNPSIRYGTATNLNLAQAVSGMPMSRILLRFRLPVALLTALAGGAELGGGTLRMTTFLPCPSCASATTTFAVHTLVDTWNEGNGAAYVGAGWCQKIGMTSVNQVSWGLPGADGPGDRSAMAIAELAVVDPPPAGSIDVPLPSATMPVLAAAITNDQLSLILIPSSGGTLFVHARENSSQLAPSLVLRACEP